jgi:hypothetical protein
MEDLCGRGRRHHENETTNRQSSSRKFSSCFGHQKKFFLNSSLICSKLIMMTMKMMIGIVHLIVLSTIQVVHGQKPTTTPSTTTPMPTTAFVAFNCSGEMCTESAPYCCNVATSEGHYATYGCRASCPQPPVSQKVGCDLPFAGSSCPSINDANNVTCCQKR